LKPNGEASHVNIMLSQLKVSAFNPSFWKIHNLNKTHQLKPGIGAGIWSVMKPHCSCSTSTKCRLALTVCSSMLGRNGFIEGFWVWAFVYWSVLNCGRSYNRNRESEHSGRSKFPLGNKNGGKFYPQPPDRSAQCVALVDRH
jgi:hypothetical protein